MRYFALCALLLGAPGCEMVRQDLGSTGGFVGVQMDTHMFPAVTRQQHADRYLMSFMVLAPLALDTAADAQQARATIGRVNATWRSLADLYRAADACEPGTTCAARSPTPGLPNGYSFETASYEVQLDFYFLAKDVIVNLDLDSSAGDLASLDMPAMLTLATRVRENFPVARRAAATWRDGTILFADAVAQGAGGADACAPLKATLARRYSRGTPVAETRDIAALLRAAEAASKDCPWSLSPQQRQAALYHIDSACARAFRRQALSEHAEDAPPSSCGLPGQNDGTAAPARQAFADILTAPPS